MQKQILNNEDMDVAKLAHELVLMVYAVCAKLPDDEKYGLSSQLKRAVVSIASNIAEGFNRRTTPDKAHFYTMAQGSVAEVQSQLKIVVVVGHLSEAEVKQAINLSIRIHKMLTGLIKVTKLRVAK